MDEYKTLLIKIDDQQKPCPYKMVFYDQQIKIGSEECHGCRCNLKTTNLTVDCNYLFKRK
jgi:hypothetical protein